MVQAINDYRRNAPLYQPLQLWHAVPHLPGLEAMIEVKRCLVTHDAMKIPGGKTRGSINPQCLPVRLTNSQTHRFLDFAPLWMTRARTRVLQQIPYPAAHLRQERRGICRIAFVGEPPVLRAVGSTFARWTTCVLTKFLDGQPHKFRRPLRFGGFGFYGKRP